MLKDIANNLKNLKSQLTLEINSIYSNDINEECVMHVKRDNIRTMINDKADEAIK